MESTWMGQQVQSSTLSAAPSLETVEEAVFGNTDLWIDNSGAIGTTQITGTLMAAEINISDTGVREVPTADGTNYYTNIKYSRPSIDFSLTFELENVETAVSTARSKFESDTIQVFQIHVPGSGTSNVKFRFAGRYTDFGDYTNDNGNTSVQVGGRVIYSIADSLFFEMDVINSLATLP